MSACDPCELTKNNVKASMDKFGAKKAAPPMRMYRQKPEQKLDVYRYCPCGSGKKIKWCEKSHRETLRKLSKEA